MCGIVGIWNVPKSAELAVIGMHAQQHRARDYACIVSSDGRHFYREHGKGVARDVFGDGARLNLLHGRNALGHIRYPTVEDDSSRDNTQPIVGIYNKSWIAIAHNGNLTNKDRLPGFLKDRRLATSMDTEYILRILEEQQTGNIERDLAEVFSVLEGSITLGVMLPDQLIAAVDRSGNRPLSVGKLDEGWCISSESCAFPNMGASHYCDVEPGSMIIIRNEGLQMKRFAEADEKRCVFELLYYAQPASEVFGVEVDLFRDRIGEELESVFPTELGIEAIVTPIPDSSNAMALGVAHGNGTRYRQVIYRNHYVGRTFIAAEQASRDEEVDRKFVFSAKGIAGKKIGVVDDSIVRGTTLRKVIARLRQLGAREIHVRIGTPPITHPCRYGINMVDEENVKLISADHSPNQIRTMLGADSLEFLPLSVLQKILPDSHRYCFACMDGKFW